MEKKKTIITISATLALILLVATATYAYFEADLGNNKEVDVTVSTVPQTDLLSFSVGDPLALQADETSFVKGGDSASDTTNVKAVLTANRDTKNATKYYYVYLLISENGFVYTQDTNTPELILSIKKPDGTELTTIDGLTYKTVTDGKGITIKGFDITTKKGLITIADNKKITTTSIIEEQWNVIITLVNYNVNQIDNLGKEFNSKLIISQDGYKYPLAEYLKLQYTGTQGGNNLYYHDSTLANGAGDNSYRYAGASDSVNNYICLGSDEATCPDDNLFRIIGVFNNQVKVIKATSTGSQPWNSPASNTWSTSSLNKYLNGTYLTSLGTLANKIATTTWKVGGGSPANIRDSVPATAYQYEVGANASATTYDAKIGLMYVTDYEFAASPNAWTLVGHNSNSTKDYRAATSTNWLFLGSTEWTISRLSDTNVVASLVDSAGNVFNSTTNNNHGVRPSFNLKSSVKYVSGSGSMSDPVRVTD